MTSKIPPSPPTDDEATKTVKMSVDELRKQLHDLGVDVDAAANEAERPSSTPSSETAG